MYQLNMFEEFGLLFGHDVDLLRGGVEAGLEEDESLSGTLQQFLRELFGHRQLLWSGDCGCGRAAAGADAAGGGGGGCGGSCGGREGGEGGGGRDTEGWRVRHLECGRGGWTK